MGLDDVLRAYSSLGYHQFEAFTSWTKSALDYHADPEAYVRTGKRFSMAFTSLHLPVITTKEPDSLEQAVCAARFAARIGTRVVLFKADDRKTYVSAAAEFLDAMDGVDVVPVIQNHYGTPLTTLEDVREVREGIGDDRMGTLLEVGHFHSAGVGWREAVDYLGDSIALVHIKDQVGRQSVPFGQGEIDLYALFRHMDERGYSGHYVIEMEVKDSENTLTYLADARAYVLRHCEETA